MAESPADPEPSPETPADDGPGRAPEPSAATSNGSAAEFGNQQPTRFAADVEYRGRVEGHDYLVRVRHRFLDTRFIVVLDGAEHDPEAEEKAEKAEKAGKVEQPVEVGTREKDATGPEEDDRDDGLRFRLEEHLTVTYCTVRRPGEDGALSDAEVLAVRTSGLGGAGEVEVRHGLERWPLAPEDGSPSAVRDAKRLAHPTRYAALAALTRTLGYLLPMLGLGALFAGFLDPVRTWIAERVRPLAEWAGRLIAPVREWLAEVLRPIREFLDELLAPVREFIAGLLRPLVEAWHWFWEMVRGWLPRFDLSGVIPEWVVDVAVPVIVVLAVFSVTLRELRRRKERLEAARAATADRAAAQAPPTAEQPGQAAADDAEADDDATNGAEDDLPDSSSPGSSPP